MADTIGALATSLAAKQSHNDSVIDVQRELHTDYEKNIQETIMHGIKEATTPVFYIVVITKKEPLLPNVYRNYYFVRISCPTPDYDQTVYHYDKKSSTLTFLWVIPSRDSAIYLINHAREVHLREKNLLKFVLAFADGHLFRLAKRLNGEQDDSIELEKDTH